MLTGIRENWPIVIGVIFLAGMIYGFIYLGTQGKYLNNTCQSHGYIGFRREFGRIWCMDTKGDYPTLVPFEEVENAAK